MIERQIGITTASGEIGTFICHPERHAPHPVAIIYMDAPGIREELRDLARRLACVGYYVMLPNLYHRDQAEEIGSFMGEAGTTGRQRAFALMETLTIAKVMDDTQALIAFAGADSAAQSGTVLCVGYCMSGRYAISAAAHFPDKVVAAASFYGTRMVTDQPDSLHLNLAPIRGEIYVGYAEIDSYVPAAMMEEFGKAVQESGITAELELYPGVEHGFAFPQRAAYDKAAAERHWERVFALFWRAAQVGPEVRK